MKRNVLMAMAVAAIVVVAALVLNTRPGVDPAETSAVQTE
jgi:hypothetical protein